MFAETWFVRTIKRMENSLALGYESTLDFNYGMIRGWLAAKLISKKFANELEDNFAHASSGEPEWCDHLEKKYGRLL